MWPHIRGRRSESCYTQFIVIHRIHLSTAKFRIFSLALKQIIDMCSVTNGIQAEKKRFQTNPEAVQLFMGIRGMTLLEFSDDFVFCLV